MKIYLSGKITGTTDYKRRFGKAARRLAKEGYKVVEIQKWLDHTSDGKEG